MKNTKEIKRKTDLTCVIAKYIWIFVFIIIMMLLCTSALHINNIQITHKFIEKNKITFYEKNANYYIIETIFEILFVILCGFILTIFLKKYVKKKLAWTERMQQACIEIVQKMYRSDPDLDQVNDLENFLEIASQGLVDQLTGLATRGMFFARMKEKQNFCYQDKIMALCLVDFDDLKSINDKYGHGAGDMALQRVGQVLKNYEERYHGIAGRFGGDEFIVLLTKLDNRQQLESILEELVKSLCIQIKLNNEMVLIHCSIGASISKDKDSNIEEMIQKTDIALYQAKKQGKNQFYLSES